MISATLGWVADRVTKTKNSSEAAGLLESFKLGLAGRAKIDAPIQWTSVEKKLQSLGDSRLSNAVGSLSVLFGDGAAMGELRKLASSGENDPAARENAIRALAQAKDSDSIPMLFNLLGDRAVVDAAIEALRMFDHPETARQLLDRYAGFRDGNKQRALDTLASRPSYAKELVAAIEGRRPGRARSERISSPPNCWHWVTRTLNRLSMPSGVSCKTHPKPDWTRSKSGRSN